MTDPLKLAEEIERCRPPYVNADERDARLLAAALRLAEALNERDSLVAANPLDAIEHGYPVSDGESFPASASPSVGSPPPGDGGEAASRNGLGGAAWVGSRLGTALRHRSGTDPFFVQRCLQSSCNSPGLRPQHGPVPS